MTRPLSPYGHELFATGTPKPAIIARRKTADDKIVALWNDGSLTWALGNAIKGSANPRTPAQIAEALRAGWLVLGEVELYDAEDVPRLVAAARNTARRGGLPGDVRAAANKDAPLKPHWEVYETDRDGKPKVRVWRLPRLSHPGVVIWDEVRGSGGTRYRVLLELPGRGKGTLRDTGVKFSDLGALSKYLRETSKIAAYR